MRFPVPFARILAVVLQVGAVGRGVGAEPSLAVPTEQAARAVAALAERSAPAVAGDWGPQTAPGVRLAPAPDARRRWMVLQGWAKVPVSKADGGAVGVSPQELPDVWPRARDHECAWYVFRADLGAALPESLWLCFDAVASQCEVFVNGRHVGGHIGGFTPFECDVTSVAHPGANTITLFVRDEHAIVSAPPQAAVSQLGLDHPDRPASPAGIRGGVFLEARNAVHVDRVLVQTSTRRNEIRVSTWLRPAAPPDAAVTHAIYVWPDGAEPVLVSPEARAAPGAAAIVVAQPWAGARRWSPEHPQLYFLRTTLRSGGKSETFETRFGFREFWTEGKDFILNGTPIRLIGTSVARDLNATEAPEVGRRFSRDVLAFLKREFNYRAMRLHASIHPPGAAEAADEVGVLLINQSSIWSAMGSAYQRGGDAFLANMEREFAEWFWRDANHPSIVIWDVENEMIRDLRTPERERWVLALDRFIKQLDPTRIVEHSGAAWYSPLQETIHLHMQEQYSEPLRAWARAGRVPLVLGEFWVGGRGGETRLSSGYEYADRLDWLQEESRLYREKILEMRNYGASGVMPFWLDRLSLGRINEGPRRTYDPPSARIFRWPYPGLRNLGGEALAPVIAFAWPRGASVLAGTSLAREVVVCNDRESAAQLSITCAYAGRREQWQVTLAPATQDRHPVVFPAAASGEFTVSVTDATGRPQSGDVLTVHAIAPDRVVPPRLSRRLVVRPAPDPATAAALRELGLPAETVAAMPTDAAATLLLVPPGAARDALGRDGVAVRQYLLAGGRLLVLAQTERPDWLPLALPFWSTAKKSAPEFTRLGWPTTTRHLIFSRELPLYAPGHPAFAGLASGDLAEWNELDGRVGDDAFVRPGAVDTRAGAPYRVLAGGTRRENASLLETAFGEGTAIFCQAEVPGPQAHPAARALFLNLLRYLDGPAWRAAYQEVGVVGELTAARLSALTGLRPAAIAAVGGPVPAPHVVLAGDRADPASLDALVRGGHTVIVLSRETAGRLAGYTVVNEPARVIGGTRARTVDNPLFWGVASASFLPLEHSPARGVLAKFPAAAHVLLRGLSGPARPRGRVGPGATVMREIEMMDGDQVLAVAEARGPGRLVVTSLEPWDAGVESHRQLLGTLVANAGVALPGEGGRPSIVAVKATVALQLDGRLDDWTNDMEDRNVSQFQHAGPVVLSSRDVIAGAAASDADLSGVVYFLHDAANLYVAGIVFSAGGPRIELELDQHLVTFDLQRRTVAFDGQPLAAAQLVVSRQAAREVSDTRLLTLTSFNPQIGSLSAAIDTPGRTFEALVPFAALGLAAPPAELPARVRLHDANVVLQVPLPIDGPAVPALTLRFERP